MGIQEHCSFPPACNMFLELIIDDLFLFARVLVLCLDSNSLELTLCDLDLFPRSAVWVLCLGNMFVEPGDVIVNV